MYCERCGKDLEKGDKFCSRCGTRVRKDGSFEESRGKAKVEVTPSQLGKVLFVWTLDLAQKAMTNREFLEELGIEKIDKDHLLKEMIIINMFAMVTMFEGLLDDKDLEVLIMKHMLETYSGEFRQFGLSEKEIKGEHSFALLRFEEYREAGAKEAGGNWLWPTTRQMVNNLRQEETKDIEAVINLMSAFAALMETIPTVIESYEIVRTQH